jgi:hypothetical protein
MAASAFVLADGQTFSRLELHGSLANAAPVDSALVGFIAGFISHDELQIF